MDAQLQEEIIVLFHASLIGRTDVVQNAISSLKASGKLTTEEVATVVSTGRSEDGASPLHIATNFGHSDVIRALLNAGADPTATPDQGEYEGQHPYDLANETTKGTYHVYLFEQIAMGNDSIIQRLVDGGVPVDTVDDSDVQDSTLHWACSFGSTAVAGVLLANGCSPNITNADGHTPLHLACKGCHYALVEMLLNEGALTNKTDKHGKTAAELLPESGRPEMKEMLKSPPTASMKYTQIFEKKLEEAAAALERKRQLETELLKKQQQQELEQNQLLDQPNQQDQEQKQQQQQEMASKANGTVSASFDGDNEEKDIYDTVLFASNDSSSSRSNNGAPSEVESPSSNSVADNSQSGATGTATGTSTGTTPGGRPEKELLLIFWPPVQRQQLKRNTAPLILNNSMNLLISVVTSDIDIFPLLTWSGLMDLMDLLGFQVQVKRSSAGAKIRLCIDKNICPVPNSYELSVGREQLHIIAADSTGLLYAVYTLIQLLKLHSEVHTDASGVTTVAVPAINISDMPNVAQRGVLWSYREKVRCTSFRMQEQIELLSRLRMNALFLVIDPTDDANSTAGDESSTAGAIPAGHSGSENGGAPANSSADGSASTGTGLNTTATAATDVTSTKVYALDEMCRRHCVDLIPTLIIHSIHQRLPLDVLKNFSQTMISLVFVFDHQSVAKELVEDLKQQQQQQQQQQEGDAGDEMIVAIATDIDEATTAAACVRACEQIVRDAHLVDCTTLSLASSDWTRRVADPMELATNAGLNASERDFAVMYPSSLFTKPVISVQDYVQSINAYSMRVEEHCASVTLFPAFMERDFMYPVLLLKFFVFIFAGFSWNRNSLIDMLGDPSSSKFSANIVREVMYLLMFPPKVQLTPTAFNVMMDLITGLTGANASSDLLAMDNVSQHAKLQQLSVATGTNSQLNGNSAGSNHTNSHSSSSSSSNSHSGTELAARRRELAQAEKLLWSLLTSHDPDTVCAVPTKSQAALCLKLYRRVLLAAEWRPDTLANRELSTGSGGLLGFVSVATFSRNLDGDDAAGDGSGGGVHSSSSGGGGSGQGLDGTPAVLLDAEELFCTINMLSALCKILVLGYKAYEKKHPGQLDDEALQREVPFEELFDGLAVGTKSDVANSILESLSNCTYLWKRRFDRKVVGTLKENNHLLLVDATNSSSNNNKSSNNSKRAVVGAPLVGKSLMLNTVKEANERFLLQASPTVPAAAVFKLVSQRLPLPKSVEDFIKRLFNR